ncbi:hypothetical protein KY342_06340 [Candidatus Woesearchaeota archaeon]|nr:hypothetical protein [Candidatus Woesearchaeota archaeon]
MKILFLGQGSGKDPGFDDINIDGKHYKEYMKERGTIVLEKVVESCHGCPDIMTNYSGQMQNHIEIEGGRVVAVLQGGLLFGLPSIQATQVTYPIISTPLDMVAYTAFMVPSGHACIAGTGIDKEAGDKYETKQREKALRIAEKMLSLEDSCVYIAEDDSNGKLAKELTALGIQSKQGTNLGSLNLYYSEGVEEKIPGIVIWADSTENLQKGDYFDDSEAMHRNKEYDNAVQVRGIKNLAIYAAKILSLQKPELREKIKKIGEDKRKTYKERNLPSEIVDGWNKMVGGK